MLEETDLFGTRSKVQDAIAFLREHEPPEGYYVAFSGGKDSVVLLDLVRKSGVKHDVHMNLTSVDPPELLKFVREHYSQIDFVKPKISMHNLIIKKGFPPTRAIRYCCDYLKEQAGKGRYILVGVRAEESGKRAQYPFIDKSRKLKNTTFLRPILKWLEGDIWDYIELNNLPYCSLYDEGFSRIGCVMCPKTGPKKMKLEAERWPAIYKMYLGAMEKAIIRSKERGKTCGQKSGQEMMDWWLDGLKVNIK